MILPQLVAVASDIESIVLVISCSGMLAVWLVGWLVGCCFVLGKASSACGSAVEARREGRWRGVGWHHVQWRVCDVSL